MTDPQNTLPRPDPLAFDAYRPYLLAMIAWLRVAEPRFSYRWFARRAGFSAPNYLKLVAEGDRSLALASVDRFAKGLGLDARELLGFAAGAAYFPSPGAVQEQVRSVFVEVAPTHVRVPLQNLSGFRSSGVVRAMEAGPRSATQRSR